MGRAKFFGGQTEGRPRMGKRTYKLVSGDIINLNRPKDDSPWTHMEVDGYYVRRADIEFLGDRVKAPIPIFDNVYCSPNDCDSPNHLDDSDNWRLEQVGTKIVWRPRASVKLLNLVEATGTEVWEAEDLPSGGVTVSRVS